MRIHVTQKDIDEGKQRDSKACPIALAAKRRLTEDHVYVSRLTLNTPHANYWLPPEAIAFIANFDNNRPVRPFRFTPKAAK